VLLLNVSVPLLNAEKMRLALVVKVAFNCFISVHFFDMFSECGRMELLLAIDADSL